MGPVKQRGKTPRTTAVRSVRRTATRAQRSLDPRAVQRARNRMQAPEAVSLLAETFSVLGDPTRLRIAFVLSQQELCVSDIAEVLSMSQSVVSHSLRALRQMRLVRHRR